jgi:hypothetical protein
MAPKKRFSLSKVLARSDKLIAQDKFKQAVSYLKHAMAKSRAAATNYMMWQKLGECYKKLGNEKMALEASHLSRYYTFCLMSRENKIFADAAKDWRKERAEAERERKKAALDFIKGKARLAKKGNKRALQFLERIRKIIS